MMTMRQRLLRPPVLITAGAALSFSALLLASTLGTFRPWERLEWITHDWRVTAAASQPAPVCDNLAFVPVSDETIALFTEGKLGTNFQFGLYWPRHVYGRVIRELSVQGAKTVALDVLFSERRPDHPPIIVSNTAIESDRFFQQQLKRAGNTILASTPNLAPHLNFRANTKALGDISAEHDGDGVVRRIRAFHDCRVWHPEIRYQARLNNWNLEKARVLPDKIVLPKATGGEDSIAINSDRYFDPSELQKIKSSSGFVRLQKAFEDLRIWNMGLVMAAQELQLDLNEASVELDKGRIVIPGKKGMERVIPVDKEGRMIVDWRLRAQDERIMRESFETLLANDLLRERGASLPERFRDKLVLIGSVATGSELTDRGATPLENDTFLTSTYFNVANSVINDRFIKESPATWNYGLIFLMAGLAGVCSWKRTLLVASISVAAAVLGYLAAARYVFVHYHLLMPIILPLGTLVCSYFVFLCYQLIFERQEQRRIRSIFSKIVSPNVVTELLQSERLALVGSRRKITVFFADIRGFTEMTDETHARAEKEVRKQQFTDEEAMAFIDAHAQEVLATVNSYLAVIANLVMKHEGTLDKYIGDCVMAFWGAPIATDAHALLAVRAAIDAQRAVDVLNRERASENLRRQAENLLREQTGQPLLPMLELLSLGTGINTGVVTVGLMGSDAHIRNYTVFGREVNVAARLEAVSGRGRIVIGESTYLELLQFDPELGSSCIELEPVAVKGIRTPVKIFEVPWKDQKTGSTEIIRLSSAEETQKAAA